MKEMERDGRLENDESRCLEQNLEQQSSIILSHLCRVKSLMESCDMTMQIVCPITNMRSLHDLIILSFSTFWGFGITTNYMRTPIHYDN